MKFTIFGYTIEVTKTKDTLPYEVCFKCGKRDKDCQWWRDGGGDNDDYACPKCLHKLMAEENRRSFLDISKHIEEARPKEW